MVGTEVRRCWRPVLQQLAAALQSSGLDLLAPVSLEWYNAAVPPALHLPYLGRDRSPLAIVVGNSKNIWEPFISALRKNPSLLNNPHPLNTFVVQSVSAALSPFHVVDSNSDQESAPKNRIRAAVYWDFDTRPGHLVAMQRAAQVAGMASFNESSKLCVHPVFGPWFALRALVLFDLNPPLDHERVEILQWPSPTALVKPKRIDVEEEQNVVRAESAELGQWRAWLALRDAIHPNHPMRYEWDQIEYHYTHDKEILTRLSRLKQ